MLLPILIFKLTALAGCASALATLATTTSTPTTGQSVDNATLASSTTTQQPSAYTTISLYLGPVANTGRIGASIISVGSDHTAFALDCIDEHDTLSNATTTSMSTTATTTQPQCAFSKPVTLTEGVSTLVYTYPGRLKIGASSATLSPTSMSAGSALVACQLLGGTRATQAVCTGSSIISGLGNVGMTTTLASTQIDYVAVTVTAGAQKLGGASAGSATASSRTGGAAAAPARTAAPAAFLMAAGMAVLGGI